jgi:MSHA biogenesis protein MshQ
VNTTAITAAAKISCSFKFDDAGFTIYVPNRVAGTINPDVTIDALTKATTGTCTGAFPANIAQPVHLYTTYSNPTSGTKSVTVTTGTVSTTSPGTVHNLTFNAAGRATTALYYPDVGQVTLNATGTAPNGVAMSSTGGSFVVKPGGFVLSNIVQTASPNTMNPAATSATGTKFVKAGEQFSVTVTATTCMPGVTNCISPTAVPQATPNFGLESPAESVKLNSTLVTGLGLTDIPAIASVTGFTSFTGGVSTGTDFSWPEVGIVTLTPSLKSGNYLSVAGDTAGTVSGNVGRFYAASLGVTSGSITNRTDFSCTSPCIAPDAFTYMGESMSAVFTLTALALDGTTRLQNYVDTFAKLDPTATASLNFGAIDTATTRTPLTSRISTTGLPAATGKFSSTCTTSPACLGTAKVTAPLTITRGASADGPYAALTVGIVPQDSDGATVKFDLDTTNLTATTSDHASVGSTAVRYGQLKFANAYGSELLSLSMPVYAQYWNGLAYANNTQDNQTSFASTNVTFGNYSTSTLTATNYPNSGTTAITPASVVFSSGTSNLTLAKPGRGNVGSVDLTCSYLSYLPTNNAGRATFGIYKNNGSIIYMRENY